MKAYKVTVLADFPLFQDKVHGGLQRKVFSILKTLVNSAEIDLFCGEETNLHLDNCKMYPAFNRTCDFKSDYDTLLNKSMTSSQLVISFETALPLHTSLKKVLILGGFAYDWSKSILLSAPWDKVIVPSVSSRSMMASFNIPITVIPNGYDWNFLVGQQDDANFIKDNSQAKILISPHRPDLGKGHFESIILVKNLLKKGLDCKLLIPRQDFFLRSSDFYIALKEFAAKNIPLENLVLHYWLPSSQIGAYYTSADLTLGLGTLEEGFGAFVVESIYCLTPVFARSTGAIPSLLPPNHGLFLASDEKSDWAEQVFEILTTPKDILEKTLLFGKEYVREHYSEGTMSKAYLNIFKEMASAL